MSDSQPESGAEPPPPAYTAKDAEKSNPPPSYDSLFGKMKKAKEESTGNVDFAKKCCMICTGSLLCTIMLGICLGLPISYIVIGAIYLDDCPAEDKIPIYLIVNGVFVTVQFLKRILKGIFCKSKDDEEDDVLEDGDSKSKSVDNCFDGCVDLFLFAWFICGNVWVYGLNWVSTPTTAWNYCHPTLYYFAFWTITLTYILFGLACICACGCFAFLICKFCGKSEE